ncbi:MAG: 3-phytase, partial [Ideonella sp.]
MLTLKRTSLSLATGLALAALGTAALAAPTFSLSKNGLQWAGEPGTPPARLAVRGKQLDQRPAQGSTPALALLLDSDQAQPLLVQAPASTSTKLQPWTALPVLNFNVEALCLYRDAQALTHLFAIGSNGLTEQWLLSEQGHRLLRRLALPAGSEHCQADDATGQLYVSQPGLGVWRYAIAEEGAPTGVPVSLRKPWGRLAFAPGALKLQGGQLMVSEDDGPRQARYPLAGAALSSLPIVQA